MTHGVRPPSRDQILADIRDVLMTYLIAQWDHNDLQAKHMQEMKRTRKAVNRLRDVVENGRMRFRGE